MLDILPRAGRSVHISFRGVCQRVAEGQKDAEGKSKRLGKVQRKQWGERAASGDALMTKAVSDVSIEIGAFRCGGDQILKNSGWNAEVAVDRASAKLQLERFIGGVSRRLEQGRIQSRVETPGHGAISLVMGWPLWCRLNDSLLPYQRVGSFLSKDILLREEDRNLWRDSLPVGRPA